MNGATRYNFAFLRFFSTQNGMEGTTSTVLPIVIAIERGITYAINYNIRKDSRGQRLKYISKDTDWSAIQLRSSGDNSMTRLKHARDVIAQGED
jgi:hypothetical protein